MTKLFALADLHLSLSGAKPMDVFGEAWVDHAARMADAWDGVVGRGDTVLIPGDISWAKNLEEAAPDLAWIGERPGRKILLRGNHDSWWTAVGRVRRALPPGCEALQNDSVRVGDWVVLGARGWVSPEDPTASPEDERVFRREVERLRLSIADADRRHGRERPRIAMLHYPPWLLDRDPTEVVTMLRDAGVRICVYGHLHGEDHGLAVRGEHGGIRFCFVASDAVGFRPRLILEETAWPVGEGWS
ncbi:MAG: metallophosphoesterase [Acidobacteriota bacterium]|nr:metallophosphoesterase [Acidobacteriota bacterium]